MKMKGLLFAQIHREEMVILLCPAEESVPTTILYPCTQNQDNRSHANLLRDEWTVNAQTTNGKETASSLLYH
jgi:hypothetical protein